MGQASNIECGSSDASLELDLDRSNGASHTLICTVLHVNEKQYEISSARSTGNVSLLGRGDYLKSFNFQ